MKKIGILHTVESVCKSFTSRIEKEIADVKLNNLLDDYLVTETKQVGYFPTQNMKKLYFDLCSLELESPDLIVVSCSSLTPYVKQLCSLFEIGIICIDERMCHDAAESGNKIAVIATAPTTLGPTVSRIEENAIHLGKKVEIKTFLVEEAMEMLSVGNVSAHDEIICSLADDLSDFDTVVLAQASMASAEEKLKGKTGKLVLSSPELCIQDIKDYFEKRRGN